jgi:hypothetical protein
MIGRTRRWVMWFVFGPKDKLVEWSGCTTRKEAIRHFVDSNEVDELLEWPQYRKRGYTVRKCFLSRLPGASQ